MTPQPKSPQTQDRDVTSPEYTDWTAIGGTALLVAAGTILLCMSTSVCFFNDAPPQPSRQATGASGKEAMLRAPAGPGVDHADAADFDRKVLRSDVPVLVDFYADWCAPCRAMSPVLEELARENPSVRIVKVNVDESPELASRYRVDTIPRLIVFKGGRPTAQHSGIADKARLNALLNR
jgi:thioredoxin 1